jgi:hypothetical protein
MAIIHRGRVLLAGDPGVFIRALKGQIWQKTIAHGELDAAKASLPVISTRLMAGRNLVNVVANDSPGPGFVAVEPTLEDVYFAAIGGRLSAGAEAGAAVPA